MQKENEVKREEQKGEGNEKKRNKEKFVTN